MHRVSLGAGLPVLLPTRYHTGGQAASRAHVDVMFALPMIEPSTNSHHASPEPADLAEPGHDCFQCGYDLRGTGPSSSCTECGLPVATSIRYWDEDPKRNAMIATILLWFFFVYIMVNYFSPKDVFIPSMADSVAWGFILPIFAGLGGTIISSLCFRRRSKKWIGSVCSCGCSTVIGFWNYWGIAGIWTSI